MTTEEKARAYDEAIRKAKITLDCCDSASIATKNTVYGIFPELKESEDERIRKWIIDDIRYNMDNETLKNSEYKKQAQKALDWLEKQCNKIVDCPQNHQDVNHPNGGIVMVDFNGGEGFYKLHLDYLSKKQVEDVEEMVRMWNKKSKTSDDNIKNCIGMCLTDANEQRFKDYGTNLKDCLKWLEKQDEQTINHTDIKEKAHQIAWETSKDYDPSLSKESWCEMAALDMASWLEKQGESNPYSGVSFKYNGHIWGMCARDNGIEIAMDGKPVRQFSYKDCEQTFGGKSALEAWKDMRLEVYQQASGNRHEPNYSDDTTKMFSLNDIDEIIEKISEQNPYGQRKKCSDCQFNYAGECKGSCQMKIGEQKPNGPSMEKCINCQFVYTGYCNGTSCILKNNEQKADDRIEPKFKVGDWCIDNEDGVIFQIVKVLDNTYTYRTNEGKEYSCTHYSLENDVRLWTIQDTKDGDVLVTQPEKGSESNEQIFLFKAINSRDYVDNCIEYYCRLCDGIFYENTLGYMGTTLDIFHPATKEQCDMLFQKMKEAGYEWDAEKKKLLKV